MTEKTHEHSLPCNLGVVTQLPSLVEENQCFLNVNMHTGHCRVYPVKNADSDSVGLVGYLRLCISSKISGNEGTSSAGAILKVD